MLPPSGIISLFWQRCCLDFEVISLGTKGWIRTPSTNHSAMVCKKFGESATEGGQARFSLRAFIATLSADEIFAAAFYG